MNIQLIAGYYYSYDAATPITNTIKFSISPCIVRNSFCKQKIMILEKLVRNAFNLARISYCHAEFNTHSTKRLFCSQKIRGNSLFDNLVRKFIHKIVYHCFYNMNNLDFRKFIMQRRISRGSPNSLTNGFLAEMAWRR